jgi:hypothetical protein
MGVRARRSIMLLAGIPLALALGGCAVVNPPALPPTEPPATPAPPTPTPFTGFAPTRGEVSTPTPMPTPQPTATLGPPAGLSEVTYQSRRFGYAIRVPSGWSVVPAESRPGDAPDEFDGPIADGFTSTITIRGLPLPAGVSDNRTWLGRQLAAIQDRRLPLTVLRSVPVADGAAALITYPDSTASGQRFRVHQVNFVRDDRAWVASLSCAESAVPSTLPDYLDMLTTFQTT